MDIAALVEGLAAPEKDERRVAHDALVGLGPAAVGPVLDALSDESPRRRSAAADVLVDLGDAAFDPLVALIAETAAKPATVATKNLVHQAGRAFGRLRLTDEGRYAEVLRHPTAEIRREAVLELGRVAPPRFVADLAPLLVTDPDSRVRGRVLSAFREMGADVVPLLRRMRRAPGARRWGALMALTEVIGWDGLDDADRALIGRLIAVKSRREVPRPFHLCGGWFAVRTGDQGAVLDAFGLSGAMPVTMRMGGEAWNRDNHARDGHSRCSRMYVSPVLDGWTLVFGNLPEREHGTSRRRRLVRDRCASLSARFGAAHWYGMSCGDDWTAWCLAEGGAVTRCYDVFELEDRVGTTHPAEEGFLLPHEDPGLPLGYLDGIDLYDVQGLHDRIVEVRREHGVPEECHATDIAARTSVDPSTLGPGTAVEGQGVIGLTACGVEHGTPVGAVGI